MLELGGSDPFIILDDVDFDRAAEVEVWSRVLNGGQSCIAAKRFLIHTNVYDKFLDRLPGESESLIVGDLMAEATDVGP